MKFSELFTTLQKRLNLHYSFFLLLTKIWCLMLSLNLKIISPYSSMLLHLIYLWKRPNFKKGKIQNISLRTEDLLHEKSYKYQ